MYLYLDFMNKISIFLTSVLIGLIIPSCIKTKLLKDGITRVPIDNGVYINLKNFNKNLLNIVDTSVIYEEYNMRYKILQRLDNHFETDYYGCIRFYPDGRYNIFFLDKKERYDSNQFNSNYKGIRGIYYQNAEIIQYDLFTQIDGMGKFGKISGSFDFIGDTLIVKRFGYPTEINIYVKSRLYMNFINYNKSW